MAGPNYLAWVEPGTPFDAVEHARMDEDVFEYTLSGSEKNFHTLTLEIANPGVPLLAEGRDRWAWFSQDKPGVGVVPRFYGRVIAVPDAAVENELQITLRAVPDDFNEQQLALADSLKVAPYWHAAMIDPASRDNPDAALTARTQSWFIDPVTHVLSVSDNIVGEAGLLVFTADEVYDDNARVTYGERPVRSIEVKAELRWTQRAAGQFELAAQLSAAFEAASLSLHAAIPGTLISSYTADDLIKQWPVPGTSIGAGWEVVASAVDESAGRAISQDIYAQNRITVWAPDYTQTTVTTTEAVAIDITLGVFKPSLVVGYDVQRSFTEVVTFTLNAAVQDIVTDDAGDDEVLRLAVASNDMSEPILEGGGSPIGDVRRRSYMATDDGHDVMRYLLARGRASLIDRARCVDVSSDVDFERRFDVTLRHSAQIPHPIIPGGIAQGKVTQWLESGNGDSGDFRFNVTIGCCPGQGGSPVEAAGDTYVDDGYVDDGYYVREGATVLVAGDVTFTDYVVTPNDDGVDFLTLAPQKVINSIIITNGPSGQLNALPTHFPDLESAKEAYRQIATKVCLDLKPLTSGPFTTEIPVTVSDLVIPKQIDLAAA